MHVTNSGSAPLSNGTRQVGFTSLSFKTGTGCPREDLHAARVLLLIDKGGQPRAFNPEAYLAKPVGANKNFIELLYSRRMPRPAMQTATMGWDTLVIESKNRQIAQKLMPQV